MVKLLVGVICMLLLYAGILVLPIIAASQPVPSAAQSTSGTETPSGEKPYSSELKILLTVIFIFIGSTAFYTSSLICGHNIYRDFSHNVSIFLTSIVGFLLFIFSPISFIVLSPDLFMEGTHNIHEIISKIHSLIYNDVLIPFLLSSIGIGMVFGSFTLIRARFLLLRWLRKVTGLHYMIYTYQFAWDRFLYSVKRHGNIRLSLKNEDQSPEKKILEGELVYFSAKDEPREIVIKKYDDREEDEGILVNDFKDVQGVVVPHVSFNKNYDPMRDDSKAFYLCLAALGFCFLAWGARQTSYFLLQYRYQALSPYYVSVSTLFLVFGLAIIGIAISILRSEYYTWKALFVLCPLANAMILFGAFLVYRFLKRIPQHLSFGIPNYWLTFIDYLGIITLIVVLGIFVWVYGERRSLQQFFKNRVIDIYGDNLRNLYAAIENFWLNYDLSEELDYEDNLIDKAIQRSRPKHKQTTQNVLDTIRDIRKEKPYLETEKIINFVFCLLLYMESKSNTLANRLVKERIAKTTVGRLRS